MGGSISPRDQAHVNPYNPNLEYINEAVLPPGPVAVISPLLQSDSFL